MTLNFDGWPWKTIGNLSNAYISYVFHFITIREFGFDLPGGNTHIKANCQFFSCQRTHNFRGKFRSQIVSMKANHCFFIVVAMLYAILCQNGPCYKRVPTVHTSAFAMYCFKAYHIQTCHCPIYLAPSFHLIRFISVFHHEVQSMWMLYVSKRYPCKRIGYIMFYLRRVKYPTG